MIEVEKQLQEANERIQKRLEVLGDREELIELIGAYSYFFADWSVIICESVHEMITKKHALGLTCEKEQEMLADVNFFFSKTAYFNGLLIDWRKELDNEKEEIEESDEVRPKKG